MNRSEEAMALFYCDDEGIWHRFKKDNLAGVDPSTLGMVPLGRVCESCISDEQLGQYMDEACDQINTRSNWWEAQPIKSDLVPEEVSVETARRLLKEWRESDTFGAITRRVAEAHKKFLTAYCNCSPCVCGGCYQPASEPPTPPVPTIEEWAKEKGFIAQHYSADYLKRSSRNADQLHESLIGDGWETRVDPNGDVWARRRPKHVL